MFDFLFGWRKASKCKKLIKKAKRRLILLKQRRCCIIRQQRNDVVQLIKDGYFHIAFTRVEEIYKDECIVGVYDILLHFCQLISREIPYIRRHKDIPNDINEAISSLIFASSRHANLPELLHIRKLFTERYGKSFESTAVDLLPGNLVNFQVREILSLDKVTNEAKYKLLGEITKDVSGAPLTLAFNSHHNQQASTVDDDQGFLATGLIPRNVDAPIGQDPSKIVHIGLESSSNNSTTNSVPKEMVYLDDIQEFQSPFNNCENGTIDQRFFVFTSPKIITILGTYKNNQFIDLDIEKLVVQQAGEPGKCLRETSMPCKCSMKCIGENGVMRSCSLPVQRSLTHIHPKLPDYDELVAKFMAIKKENSDLLRVKQE